MKILSILAFLATTFVTTDKVVSQDVEPVTEEVQEDVIHEYPFGVIYNETQNILFILGQTQRFQLFSVGAVLEAHEVDTVVLAGPGGDFYAGLTMGDMLREEGVHIIIPEGYECISACAMMALAGEEISVEGELWFHAPFMSYVPINVPLEEIALGHGVAYLDMHEYIVRSGFHPHLTRTILQQTNNCTFLVFDSAEDVSEWFYRDNFEYAIGLEVQDHCDG